MGVVGLRQVAAVDGVQGSRELRVIDARFEVDRLLALAPHPTPSTVRAAEDERLVGEAHHVLEVVLHPQVASISALADGEAEGGAHVAVASRQRGGLASDHNDWCPVANARVHAERRGPDDVVCRHCRRRIVIISM